MLVLETVEQQRNIRWREWLAPATFEETMLPTRLTLTMPRFCAADLGLALVLAGILLALLSAA
jgi:hypothetical protein